MNHEVIVQKAKEYAARVGRVGAPETRLEREADATIYYLQGFRDGIEYLRAEMRYLLQENRNG
jgi:hypothetical protein